MSPRRSWLRLPEDAAERGGGAADLTLVCVPHAGAGASSFARWPQLFNPTVRLARVQLPGREDVSKEAPLRRVAEAVAGLGPEVMRLAERGPVAVYGHSMGALVVYELARTLWAVGLPPVHVAVSGRRAPHLPPRRPSLHHVVDNAEFLAGLDVLAGTPVPRTPAYTRYALRIARADLELGEEYVHRPDPMLDVPLSVFGGIDDPIVMHGEILAWQELTTGPVWTRLLPGGHLFHLPGRAEIAEALQDHWSHLREEAGRRAQPA